MVIGSELLVDIFLPVICEYCNVFQFFDFFIITIVNELPLKILLII